MPNSDAEKNLLFGLVALQMDFITREELIAAASVWVLDKSRPLGEILLEQGALEQDTYSLLETLVQKHLQMHGNDAEKSLAAVSLLDPVCEQLKRLGDDEIDATLAHFSSTPVDAQPEATTLAPSFAPSPGRRFRILRPHAKGGLGQVSVAIDEELHREVAFKELLDRRADDPDCRSRFLLEAEITGSLEHPGVVPVYGLGRYANGRPYYAMRFVRGKSLKEGIDRFHKADVGGRDPGGRALELRRLLGHFIDVCNTIHYAHSRGILHRDLKPGNIMLGKYGETLVVDWGLAKLIEQPDEPADTEERTLRVTPTAGYAATEMGRAVGTPPYISPEQAEGRMDRLGPASDVYSLGATLYCVLTGRAPFKGETASHILKKVQEGEFPPPREVKPQVPLALEDVCLKAMALKPRDRYPTPLALAEDLEHWLADEPVAAHRDTLGERAGRWTRRHRGWAQAGAAALLLVAAVSIAAMLLVNRARQRAVTLAAENEQLAEQERNAREEALRHFKEARNAVDTGLTGTSEALTYYPGLEEARALLLKKAAEQYERLARLESSDARLEIERGRAYLRLGDARRILGKTGEAEQAYRSAKALFAALAPSHPDMYDCPLELANSHTKLGLLLADTGRYADADKSYDSAIGRLRELAATLPDEPRIRDALATGLLNRGMMYAVVGPREKAEQDTRQTIADFEELLRHEPEQSRYLAGVSTARNALGQILVEDGRDDEALLLFNKAISTFDALAKEQPDNPKYVESRASSRIYLATVLRKMGQPAGELDAYREALGDYEALVRTMPGRPLYQENMAITRADLAQLLHELGRSAEAEAELEQALPAFAQLVAAYPQVPRYYEEQAACRDVLGQVLGDLGRNEEAKTACQFAVEAYQQLVSVYPDVPQYRERLAVGRGHLGQVLHKLGDHARAAETYRQAIESLEELIQIAPKILSYRNGAAFVYRHFGTLLQETEDAAEAEKAFRRANELWQELAGQSPAPQYLHNLARFLVSCTDPQFRDPQQAIELVTRAKEQSPQNAAYWNTLGAAHYRAGDWHQSIAAVREAIKCRQKGHARDWFFLGMAQRQAGQSEEAAESYRRGCQWMQDNCPDRPELKTIRGEAAQLLGLSEKQAAAEDQSGRLQ